ncbi:TetR/AcrR family transcriptional regulator [Sedimenticola hydrogenitrophicus]|uniref:TetR/AcrR family transcriptional regulator n=1 Tax=Sedimenticola hydrogenitrophicus TaxID=2967975 RepID=UPI0021A64D47|nr:TetR/AcrR family transcriptional regulator [Sedimenticola hydrogenitrophicus]
MGRRSDHSREEIRQLALGAAEAIVAEGGFKALTARKVAAAIGYTVGTLYLVFENLDDLVFQLNGRTLDQLYQRMLDEKHHSYSGKKALYALATAYIDYAEAESPRWNMLLEYVAGKDEVMPDWYLEKLGQVFGLVEETLASTVGNQDDKTISQAARVLWASVHGICILKIRQRLDLAGGQSTGEMACMLIDNFVEGMSR